MTAPNVPALGKELGGLELVERLLAARRPAVAFKLTLNITLPLSARCSIYNHALIVGDDAFQRKVRLFEKSQISGFQPS